MKKLLAIGFSILMVTACGSKDNSSSEEVEQVKSTTPVEGSCFNYDVSDVEGTNPSDKEVDCSESHSSEIYRVAIWPGASDPNELTPDESWELGNSVCQPWDGANDAFNYWAFYVPTPEQWAAGENWVRCDGMNVESNDPLVVTFWTGSLLYGTS